VHMASLTFSPAATSVKPGTSVSVSVLLDTEGEEVNAVEGSVTLNGGVIQSVSDGNSAIAFWITQPQVVQGTRVSFAGIIPGGRSGNALRILSLTAHADEEGVMTFGADQLRVLANDGKGTAVPAETGSTAIAVSTEVQSIAATPTRDREPPNPFIPRVVHESNLTDDRAALIFVAQDKGSGIERYDVFESKRELTANDAVRWEPAQSPYVLRDQTRGSHIYVRAVDREGNERIAHLPPGRDLAWYEYETIPDTIPCILLLLLGLIFVFILLRRWRTPPYPLSGARRATRSSRSS